MLHLKISFLFLTFLRSVRAPHTGLAWSLHGFVSFFFGVPVWMEMFLELEVEMHSPAHCPNL